MYINVVEYICLKIKNLVWVHLILPIQIEHFELCSHILNLYLQWYWELLLSRTWGMRKLHCPIFHSWFYLLLHTESSQNNNTNMTTASMITEDTELCCNIVCGFWDLLCSCFVCFYVGILGGFKSMVLLP